MSSFFSSERPVKFMQEKHFVVCDMNLFLCLWFLSGAHSFKDLYPTNQNSVNYSFQNSLMTEDAFKLGYQAGAWESSLPAIPADLISSLSGRCSPLRQEGVNSRRRMRAGDAYQSFDFLLPVVFILMSSYGVFPRGR